MWLKLQENEFKSQNCVLDIWCHHWWGSNTISLKQHGAELLPSMPQKDVYYSNQSLFFTCSQKWGQLAFPRAAGSWGSGGKAEKINSIKHSWTSAFTSYALYYSNTFLILAVILNPLNSHSVVFYIHCLTQWTIRAKAIPRWLAVSLAVQSSLGGGKSDRVLTGLRASCYRAPL